MNNLELLQQILENQNEIKHFCYFINYNERSGQVKIELSASGIIRKYKFKSIDVCLNKLVDIFQELKKSENYYLTGLKP